MDEVAFAVGFAVIFLTLLSVGLIIAANVRR